MAYFEKLDIDPTLIGGTGATEKPKSAGFLRSVADLGIEAASGVARGVKGVAGAFGADNAVAQGADAVDKFAREYLSASAKADDQRVSEIMEAAQDAGVWEQVKAAAEAFTVKPAGMIANALGTSVPTIAATMIPGIGQAGAAARLGALGAMGAAQGAGVVKGSIYEAVKAEQIKAGMSEADAEAAAAKAQEYGGENAGNIVGGAVLGGAASATGVQPVIAKMLQRSEQVAAEVGKRGMIDRALNPEGLLARTGMGALKETPLEAAQGGQEQYASNIALQNEGFDTPAFRGVAGAAALEGLASAGPGAAFGALDKPAGKKPGVADILGAPDLDKAIEYSMEAVTKPEGKVAQAIEDANALDLAPLTDAPTGIPLDDVAGFAGLLPSAKGAPPAFKSKRDADIYIGAQALFQSHEAVEAAPGRWEVQQTAATRALMGMDKPKRVPTGSTKEFTDLPDDIPVEDITYAPPPDMVPAGQAKEIKPELINADVAMMKFRTPEQIAADGNRIPTGEATEFETLPVGEVLEGDLLARDGEPFTSKTGAQAKAYASGGGKVVAIPNHFGSGVPGYVVRPLMPAQPSNTRGTDARDLPRSSNVNQPDVAGTAGQPVADGAGRPDAAVGGQLAAGRVAADATGQQPGTAAAVAPGSAGNAPAGVADAADAALSPGSRVTLNGTPYTVTAANNTAVKMQDADGITKMVARNSKTFGQIQPATGNPMLDNPASWVIREKATGKVVMETFDRAKVDALNTAKYEAVSAAKYLGELNGKPQEPNEAARPQAQAAAGEGTAPAAAPAGAPAAPAVVLGAGSGPVEADGVKPAWGLTREQYFNDPARVRREAVGPTAGGWKASYEYTEPSGAGPFKGRTVVKDKPKAGDIISAPFGRARVTTVSAAKGTAIDGGELLELGKAHHKRLVADALAAGEPVPAEVLADYPDLKRPAPERRKDLERRKRVNEMTPDEMRAALLTDDLTGLNNGRWLRENQPSFSHIVAFDADSLKWVNDNMGHEAGDMLLKAWGVALQQATPNSARMGGDEFFALANSSAEAQRIASAVEDALAQAVITASTPDGDVTIRGIGASFGIAQDRKAADEALNQHKRDREAAGTRAGRGEQPPGTSRKPASGQQDQADRGGGQDDPAGQEVAPPALTPKAQAVKEALADDRQPFEHAGLKVYPTKLRRDEKLVNAWAVQLPENKGTTKVLGDTLHTTIEAAKESAEYEARREETRKEWERKEKAGAAEREAIKEANRGKTVAQRAADFSLNQANKLPPSAGLGTGTRREAMDKAVEQGRAIRAEPVEDTAAKSRDKKAVEAVSKAGYLLGASNENIPVVKAGLEARARLKADKYEKTEYRVYGGRLAEGPFHTITKIEYDYAVQRQAEQFAAEQDRPAPAPLAATHKDPGEPAEPVTPAVVREAIKTGVQATDRKPSAMKAELLAKIDAAVKEAIDYTDFEAVVKTMGLKDATAVYTDAAKTMGHNVPTGEYSRPHVYFRVEGDGQFKIHNTVRQLLKFRAQVETSPGFKDQRAPTGLRERATDALDRRSTDAAIANMLDEGDFQAALDYAEAKEVDIGAVKLSKRLRDRLEKWQKDQESDRRMAEYKAAQAEGKPAPGSLAAAFAEKEAESAPAPAAEPEADDIPEAGVASQTFDQWVRAKYAGNEYKARYLEEFGGDERRAILGAAIGSIDNDIKTPDLLREAKDQYRRDLFALPREAAISMEVYDALTPVLQNEAIRHFYDLSSRITRRTQDETRARVDAEKAKKAPYEAAYAEVDAEIRRLDKIDGPETQKQKDLSARRDRLREALYQIGQGKEPDGRLLRKVDEPEPLDLKGFTRTPRGNGAFDLSDGNMRVSVEPTERGKFQARFGSAKSSLYLQGEQAAVDWAEQYRKDATPAAAPAPQAAPEPAAQAPAGRYEQPEEQAPAKPAPKSFRKSVKVTTAVFMEETSTFAEQEIDADTAIKALEADIAELQAFRNCIAGD